MTSNIKEFKEDKIMENNIQKKINEDKGQNEKNEDISDKTKIDSLLVKTNTDKLDNNTNMNNDDFSSFDEDFYSDVSSDNDNNNENGASSDIKKTKTINFNNYNSEYERFNIEKRRSNFIENKLMSSITKKENTNRKNLELARSINYKTIPDKIIETDEFGFLKNVERPGESPYTTVKKEEKKNDSKNENINKKKDDKKSKEYLLLINSRTEKWIYMLEHYEIFFTKKFSKLKKRTRKGIPDSLRSNVWQQFAEMKKYYKKDIFQKFAKEKLDEDTEETIIKDLDRTFPSCQLFTDKYGHGQRKLFSVLSAYSLYNKEVGYVQGMGFIAALFLIYMDEESSFFMLDSLMTKYEMKGTYIDGFPDLKKKFYVLLNLEKKFLPKIYEILLRDNVLPSLYSSEWFICLFAKDLHFNYLVRIFDSFLLEGHKVIYRFALAFLKVKEKKFLKSNGVMKTLDVLRESLNVYDIEYLFSIAFGFHLSKNLIKKIENEYEKNKNNKEDEFISQI